MRIRRLTPVVLALVACKPDAADPPKPRADDTPARLAGVWPDRFQCDSIATTDAIGQVLGGPTRAVDNPVSTQRGVAHTCNYGVVHDGAAESWMFDFDCRDGMKRTADGLFEQYRQRAADQLAEYNRRSDAGPMKPDDAGIVFERPGEAVDVQVGSKGVDDGGRGLVFIDDDAPCYARVIGGDAARRLELAKLIAKNLTFANAPMTPRAAQ
jgi:hypothetical protein